jgi:hypothetical protein
MGRRLSLVDRDQEILPQEKTEVERLEVVRIFRGFGEAYADDDHEQVAVVLLELGTAVHAQCIFHRQRMQPLDALEHLGLSWPVDVELHPQATALLRDDGVDVVERQIRARLTLRVEVDAARGGAGSSGVDRRRWRGGIGRGGGVSHRAV